jgi:Fe-Mn family superoxide dismutase
MKLFLLFAASFNYLAFGYELPDLPYAYDALEPHIGKTLRVTVHELHNIFCVSDEATMTIHHDKHHAKYTAGLNAAARELVEIAAHGGNKLHGAEWISGKEDQATAIEIMKHLDEVPFPKLRNRLRDNGKVLSSNS